MEKYDSHIAPLLSEIDPRFSQEYLSLLSANNGYGSKVESFEQNVLNKVLRWRHNGGTPELLKTIGYVIEESNLDHVRSLLSRLIDIKHYYPFLSKEINFFRTSLIAITHDIGERGKHGDNAPNDMDKRSLDEQKKVDDYENDCAVTMIRRNIAKDKVDVIINEHERYKKEKNGNKDKDAIFMKYLDLYDGNEKALTSIAENFIFLNPDDISHARIESKEFLLYRLTDRVITLAPLISRRAYNDLLQYNEKILKHYTDIGLNGEITDVRKNIHSLQFSL